MHIWGYWYFSWQSWFQLVFPPAQRFSWCTLHISYISRVTVYSLTYSFPYLEPVCCSMSSSTCCFLTCIQVSFILLCCFMRAQLGTDQHPGDTVGIVQFLPTCWSEDLSFSLTLAGGYLSSFSLGSFHMTSHNMAAFFLEESNRERDSWWYGLQFYVS